MSETDIRSLRDQSGRVAPTAVFDAGELLDSKRMRHGPLEVLWNQDAWIEPSKVLKFPGRAEFPRRSPLAWLLRARPFYISVRVAPPTDERDLGSWGRAVAERLEAQWFDEPAKDDKAVWVVAFAWGCHAGGALGSAGRLLKQLAGFEIGQAQVRVWEAR